MKKIASLLMCLMILTSVTFAQAKQDTKKTADKTTTQSKTATASQMKKDGTADKRFKAARGTSAGSSTGHLKKNGTPDMRYKTNKTGKKS